MKRILSLFIAMIALLPIVAQTQADVEDWYKKGLDFDQQGRYTEAAKWWRKAAVQGYAKAQHYDRFEWIYSIYLLI